MVECHTSIHNFEDICQYIIETLSRMENLRNGSFVVTQKLLTRDSQPCGVFFCLHGPRAVCLTAIWDTESSKILFYGSRGERVQQTRLSSSSAELDESLLVKKFAA